MDDLTPDVCEEKGGRQNPLLTLPTSNGHQQLRVRCWSNDASLGVLDPAVCRNPMESAVGDGARMARKLW